MRTTEDVTVPETPGANERAGDRPHGLPSRYQLREVIGSGGMGRVYRAHDTTLGRDVAIKVIETVPSGTGGTQPKDRFVREARAAARLAHRNIVAVHDVDPDAGWLVMDLVDGAPLRDVVARGPQRPAWVRAIAEQVLAALDAAHASGVIHRDIKPSNIMVDAHGKVTLVDFGVARLVDAELTKTGESLGTPAYMAPEQLRGGAVDARTDLYGLAATLYELVSGERMVAFEAPSAEAIARVRAACGDEHGLAQVIERCLRADPAQRIGSAREAMAQLADVRRARRWPIAVAVVALAAAVIGVIAWARSRGRELDPHERELFALTQRGEHEKAQVLLEQFVASHPDDADARTMLELTKWWVTGLLAEPIAGVDRLRPMQRDLLHGLSLLASRHEPEAIAFLEDAERQYPDTVEIAYALGEARWHGGQLEHGIATLEHAFALDPDWQMALHHILEFRLARGETAPLKAIATTLRPRDPANAAALDCKIAIADREVTSAVARARAALATVEPIPELYVCLMQAQILAGDLAGAEATSKQSLERYPIDLREWGGQSIADELLLYRGRLADYLEKLHGQPIRQRIITEAVWNPSEALVEEPQRGDAIRGQPIVPASQIFILHQLGRDNPAIYAEAPEAELRAFGRGLAAELAGDLALAERELAKSVEMPAKGDFRMLAAYALAKLYAREGKLDRAKATCEDEVIAPHMYQGYRAALLPDCLLWAGRLGQLVDAWTGDFALPAVVEARSRLAHAAQH